MRIKLILLLIITLLSNHIFASEKLRVITFNIWGLKGFLLKNPKRIAYIEDVINHSGADIVGIQESFNEHITYRLRHLSNYPYSIQGPGRLIYQFQKSGLLILSKYPIEKRYIHRFKACADLSCFEPKGTVMAAITLPSGTKLNVFNSHFASGSVDPTRVKQAQELLNMIEKYSSDTLAISVGDYNSHTNSTPIQKMQTQMVDSYMTYVEQHPELSKTEKEGLTWDGRNNPNTGGNSRSGRKQNLRFDYIFTKNSYADQIQVERSKVVFNTPSPVGFLSDHYGVQTDFIINP